MGASADRKRRFLTIHSRCYFCGDVATTIDHVPSRECFHNRVWPEGYEFPACEDCNRTSAQLEQVVALYLHMGNHAPNPVPEPQLNKLLRGVHNNTPGYLPSVELSANRKRRAARDLGYRLAPGETYADLPIAELPVQNREAFQVFERRLVCALYYLHQKQVLPNDYVIRTGHYHPSHHTTEALVKSLADIMVHTATTSRQKTSLQDQFHYLWVASKTEHTEAFAFVAQFGGSYVVFGAAGTPEAVKEQHAEWTPHYDDLKHKAFISAPDAEAQPAHALDTSPLPLAKSISD